MIRPGIRRLLRVRERKRDLLAQELEEEIRLHIDLRAEQLIRRGWAPGDAVAEARRRFGTLEEEVAMRKAASRAAQRMNAREWLGTLWQDIRYAARQLARSPGFALAAVLALGLGIGANTAMFSFVDGLLLRPPPHVVEPDRLIRIYTSDFSGPPYGYSSFPDFLDFADGLAGAAELAAFDPTSMTLDADGVFERIRVEYATPNYFDLLGIRPAAGRLFQAGDAEGSAGPVVVLSYNLWQRLYGGSSALVGDVIRLNDQPMTVVGVAARGFAGPGGRQPADAYVPVASDLSALGERDSRGLRIVGRLAPGVEVAAVASRLNSIATALHSAYPDAWTDVTDAPRRVTTLAGRQTWLSPGDHDLVRVLAGLLMGLVILVLLIACANVANLLLARATRRRQEIAVRLAIGASRGRLVRQLVTESLLLAGASALVGVLLAWFTISGLDRVGDALPINAAFDVNLDLRVLTFAVSVSVAAAILFGLLPAISTARRDPVPTLKSEGPAGGREQNVLRAGIVVGQVAICVVLLVGSSVLVQNLRSAVDIDMGFEPSGVLLVPLNFPGDRYDAESGLILYETVLEQVDALPGVEDAALGRQIPLGGEYSRSVVRPEGYQPGTGEDMEIDFDIVSPGFFELVQTRILRGRSFTWADRTDGARVAVVNEAFVDRFWPGEDPIGKRLGFRGPDPIEVVGMTATVRMRALDEEPRPVVYLPVAQAYDDDLTLHVRSTGNPEDLAPSVRARLREIDPQMPITGMRTFEDVIAEQTLPLRMAGMLFTAFGLVALTIAMIGLYGIVAYTVTQRTREIGIRLALGAQSGRVARAIITRGLILVGIGVAFGLAGGWLLTRPLEALLIGSGTTAGDGMIAVISLLAAVSVVATFMPARRATRIDPMIALRES